MKKNKFNIVISGVGGQGLITLTMIIAEAALIDGYDVKTSEVHGLSQRKGSVQTHIRFGRKVYSPLVSLGGADLILGLEEMEGLRNSSYSNPKTIFLLNKHLIPFEGGLSEKEVFARIKKMTGKIYLVPASEICRKEMGKEVLAGIYLLGCGVFKKLIPLQPQSVLRAFSKVVPKKYLKLNEEAFGLGRRFKL